MSAPENILARWSRRKLDAVAGRGRPSAEPSMEPSATEKEGTGMEAPPATRPDRNAPAPEAFDPASLPPIESITADTDIRCFLRSGVPVELTRSALRRAWTTDPAIRDFVGIAENQWDFNDPAAIPGFGLLRATDVASLAGKFLSDADIAVGRIADALGSSPSERGLERESTPEEHARA